MELLEIKKLFKKEKIMILDSSKILTPVINCLLPIEKWKYNKYYPMDKMQLSLYTNNLPCPIPPNITYLLDDCPEYVIIIKNYKLNLLANVKCDVSLFLSDSGIQFSYDNKFVSIDSEYIKRFVILSELIK